MGFFECPVCGRRPRCGWVGLVRHVAKAHPHILEVFGKKRRTYIVRAPGRTSVFGCNVCRRPHRYGSDLVFLATEADVMQHWDYHGGLASHILVEGLK